jgi:hypothetical protein
MVMVGMFGSWVRIVIKVRAGIKVRVIVRVGVRITLISLAIVAMFNYPSI